MYKTSHFLCCLLVGVSVSLWGQMQSPIPPNGSLIILTNDPQEVAFTFNYQVQSSATRTLEWTVACSDCDEISSTTCFHNNVSSGQTYSCITVATLSEGASPSFTVDVVGRNNGGNIKESATGNYTYNVQLPVELTFFNASIREDGVVLQWQTASETNNEKFQVERSAGGTFFERIGEVAGAGNSTSANHYSFLDQMPLDGLNLHRLKQIDFDGRFEYSPVEMVNYASSRPTVQIYPSLVQNELRIVLQQEELLSIRIYDLYGNSYQSQKLGLRKEATIDLQALPKGTYLIQIGMGHSVKTERFLKL